MDSLRKTFHEGDTDGSGELDLEELHVLVRKHQAAFGRVGGSESRRVGGGLGGFGGVEDLQGSQRSVWFWRSSS